VGNVGIDAQGEECIHYVALIRAPTSPLESARAPLIRVGVMRHGDVLLAGKGGGLMSGVGRCADGGWDRNFNRVSWACLSGEESFSLR
jgi:hypothetical protein